MATTTNYGWTTPDDTNLVKNGASDIRTLANAIDSTVKTNDNNALKATLADAKGDIFAASAADTVSRLAVGTNGQLLTADSSASLGVKWADAPSSGWTLIQSITANNTTSTYTFSSIPATYNHLIILGKGLTSTNSAAVLGGVRFNGDTGANYSVYGTGANTGGGAPINRTSTVSTLADAWVASYNGASTLNSGLFLMKVYNYQGSDVLFEIAYSTMNSSTVPYSGIVSGHWTGSAVNSVTLLNHFPAASNFNAGTIALYGAN